VAKKAWCASQVNTTAERSQPDDISNPNQGAPEVSNTPSNSPAQRTAIQDTISEPRRTSSSQNRDNARNCDKEDEGEGAGDDADDDDDDDCNDEDIDYREDEKDALDVTRSETAMEHLQTLLQFIDSEISPRRNYLLSTSCRKFYFSDLWYLFLPGMEVIGNNDRQVYRVVKVSSARHRVVPTWQMYWSKDNDKTQKPPFSITCVSVDFYGKQLGPVSVEFGFPRFDGEREVNSFVVYPLRFHPHRRSDFNDSEWRAVADLPEDE
jgi:hypothetical protein